MYETLAGVTKISFILTTSLFIFFILCLSTPVVSETNDIVSNGMEMERMRKEMFVV